MPSLPEVDWARLPQLVQPAFVIALLAAIESLLSASVADGMTGSRHHPNTELIGQGVGNMASALFGGLPATGAIARTATNIRSGGKSPVAGIIHAIQSQMCIPTDLMGCEMMIIAAVVLGGTTISGGRGTVLGTCLGLAVITIAKNSLILVGIPSTWQRFVLGLIIVIGTAISAYQALRASRKIAPVMTEEEEGGVVNG
jgi:hypothetical protein